MNNTTRTLRTRAVICAELRAARAQEYTGPQTQARIDAHIEALVRELAMVRQQERARLDGVLAHVGSVFQ